ncbi:hypothetical protein [Streptomyces beijiangensis]|uniref:PQQ-like domain-containing protein n=1 Tax=Streptomyces beijiangensis TaxID=163361 RepID=A0A939F8W5_9ACTN|nr:hypothetical protein [Streptomyces beijiangensis]MBO0513774.1 hypothetical protein [Streptomyces beijiangensis]
MRTLGRGTRLALCAVAAVCALPLLTAAHDVRPLPYGDRLTVHAGPAGTAAPAVLRTRGTAVEAYDRGSGRARWTYHREGRRPVGLLTAPGHAFALWSDGMVTDTAHATVRWHRAVPHPGARVGGALRSLDRGTRMLAVVTPERIMAYRTEDGDLRWVLPAHDGCAFAPNRALWARGVLLLAQDCGRSGAWTDELVAVDGLGRIVPGRTPLANERPGRTGHPSRTA